MQADQKWDAVRKPSMAKKWCPEELAALFLLGAWVPFFFEIGGCLFDWKDRRRISLRPHTFVSSSGMSYVHCLILVRAERAATNVFLLGPDG